MKSKHLLGLAQTPLSDLMEIFEVTEHQKRSLAAGERLGDMLAGRTLGMIFEKPSLRTRVSFEVAMAQLGGHTTTLGMSEVQLGKRESLVDFARTLSRYVSAIGARVYKHEHIVQLAKHSRVPVINALSDYSHPCQALADLWTIKERFGKWEGLKVAFVGDGNNVARSLAVGCAHLGMSFALAGPKGYGFAPADARLFQRVAGKRAFKLEMGTDPHKLVRGAHVVYTDVWASMGQESEKEARAKDFAPYQVNAKLLKSARKDAIVLHCLPAHREEEISSDVLDGRQAAVYDQAENRLHTERALLTLLMK